MAVFCTGFFIVMTALQITVEEMRKKYYPLISILIVVLLFLLNPDALSD